MKGITAEEPIYHRLSSCGNGTDAFRKMNQQCVSTMDSHEKNVIKHKIEKCYIERLVFDKLFIFYELECQKCQVKIMDIYIV